ncbi:MAG: hypothetical protein IJE67_06260 [Peptococcaceae bacterium]|nr:hypothetical protein [Peptococcaceae bacterium]
MKEIEIQIVILTVFAFIFSIANLAMWLLLNRVNISLLTLNTGFLFAILFNMYVLWKRRNKSV